MHKGPSSSSVGLSSTNFVTALGCSTAPKPSSRQPDEATWSEHKEPLRARHLLPLAGDTRVGREVGCSRAHALAAAAQTAERSR